MPTAEPSTPAPTAFLVDTDQNDLVFIRVDSIDDILR
jgi:hypothetical protein